MLVRSFLLKIYLISTKAYIQNLNKNPMINRSDIIIFLFRWGRGELKPSMRLCILFLYFLSLLQKLRFWIWTKSIYKWIRYYYFPFQEGERWAEASNQIVYNIFVFPIITKLRFWIWTKSIDKYIRYYQVRIQRGCMGCGASH